MAFNIWKIGLHIQQHEALAVAIVREASGWYLQRWWRIPLTPQAIVDGHIREPEQLVAALLPWSRGFLADTIFISLFPPTGRYKKFPRPTMTLREPEQTAWLSGSMARELDMAPDALHFDYSEDTLSPAFNVTAAQSKEISALLDAYPNPEGAGYGDYTGCQRVTAIYSLLARASAVSGMA